MARTTAQRRYEQQVTRRAQPQRTYEVTIICDELDARETVTVQAVDEWLARTAAMMQCTMPLTGQFVTYDVREV